MSQIVLSCKNLSKQFIEGNYKVNVLHNINLDVAVGQRVAIIGASGSGKSTLLHLLGGLDQPSTGQVYLAGNNFSTLSEKARGELRNKSLGFVYQFHHLLAEFSAQDNVAMPLMIRGVNRNVAREQARDILSQVGLAARISHTPGQLSGGERARVALARALVTKPACVLADEPTGNLDRVSAQQMFDLMLTLSTTLGIAFVVVTHDLKLAQFCDSVLQLSESGLQPYQQ